MSNIYEALEQAQRENHRKEAGDIVPLPGDTPARNIPQLNEQAVKSGLVADEGEMAELYRSINLLLPEQAQKTIQFISSGKGEGVSTVVHELAKTAAGRLGRKVLVLDAAFHNPSQHLYYRMKRQPELHSEQKDGKLPSRWSCQTVSGNLCIASLPSTDTNSCYVDIGASIAYIDECRNRFDLILIDSTPAALMPDGVALTRYVDGVILVLEAEKTKCFIADKLKEKIVRNGGNILGVVLNKRRYHIPQTVYKLL